MNRYRVSTQDGHGYETVVGTSMLIEDLTGHVRIYDGADLVAYFPGNRVEFVRITYEVSVAA